jgi:hypothetical protein
MAKITYSIFTDILLYCEFCGYSIICHYNTSNNIITVEPCEHCMQKAIKEALEKKDKENENSN